jgi:hypothetical protein
MGDVPDFLHGIDGHVGPCWAMFTAAAPPFRPGPLSLPGKGEAGTQGEETKFPVGWLASCWSCSSLPAFCSLENVTADIAS